MALARAAYRDPRHVDINRSAAEFLHEWSDALAFALPGAAVEASLQRTRSDEPYSIEIRGGDAVDEETRSLATQLAVDLAEVIFNRRSWVVTARFTEPGASHG